MCWTESNCRSAFRPPVLPDSGTRRRRAPQARAVSETGASRLSGAQAPSLDTEKHLATTVSSWADSLKTEEDLYRDQARMHKQLEGTFYKIFQRWANTPKDDGERVWWESYLAAQTELPGETAAERYKRVEKWLRLNKPTGQAAQAVKWERTWRQIQRCQTEWIGYRAACCGERSGAIAVPVGCNHRLCPFCAWRRSQVARVRIKSMYDRLTHPVCSPSRFPILRRFGNTISLCFASASGNSSHSVRNGRGAACTRLKPRSTGRRRLGTYMLTF